jgi:hypothetical protein
VDPGDFKSLCRLFISRGGFDSHTFPPVLRLGISLKWIVVIVCLLAPLAVFAQDEPAGGLGPSERPAEAAEDSVRLDEGILRAQRIELKNELRMIAREEIPGLRKWQRRKSARTAMFSTMLIPGLGQVYNGRRFKTVLVVGLSTFYMGKIWQEHKNAEKRLVSRDAFPVYSNRWQNENAWVDYHKAHSLDYAWWSGAVWLISALDAYIDAHLYDVRVYKPTLSAGAASASYVTIGFSF